MMLSIVRQLGKSRSDVADTATLPVTKRAWVGISRFLLYILVGLVSFLCTFATIRELNDLVRIATSGKKAVAQVVGKKRVAEGEPNGYIHYAFQAEANRSVMSGFPTLTASYPQYPLGAALEVSYFPGEPKVHRLGVVDTALISQRSLFWVLVQSNGLAMIFIFLALLNVRSRLFSRIPA